MKNILFIHQSADLYGSDKTLLLLLKHLDKSQFNPIVVIPVDGPLKEELDKIKVEVHIAPVLKLYRNIFKPQNLLKFFSEYRTAIAFLDTLNKENHFDIIYSNTLAVLLGVIYARKRKIKHIWHVHEIIESPKVFTRLFCKILQSKANKKIVYNSISTQNFWKVNTEIASKSIVIWNGIELSKEPISVSKKATIRKTFFKSAEGEIVIALVGRISRWKGQLLLLNAFKTLLETNQNIKLVFIGSPPPNQDGFLEKLNSDIEKYKITDKVTVIPFQHDIAAFWQSIDIAVVPSTEPEPFGLVAIEAMLAKKPVIAANHGGLTEIVVNKETGVLFEPNDEAQLCSAIQYLIDNPETRLTMGEKGFARVTEFFSIASYVKNFERLFLDCK